ncbi:MAG: FISUMP domain-containing protein [Dysgonamonadaceae bacterium]
MKTRRFLFTIYIIATAFFLFSCTSENQEALLPGSGQLTFMVSGISDGNDGSQTRAGILPVADTVVRDLGDGLSVSYILSPDPVSLTRASTSEMTAGKKYRVIVYKASDDSYVTEAEFTAGIAGSITGLENEQYKLVAISYNTTTAPANVGNATTIAVDPSNDLLHWVGSVNLTSGSASPVSIVFKHRFTKLNVRISSALTGNNITTVPSSATLTPGYEGVQTLLTDDSPARGNTVSDQTFSSFAINDTVATSGTTRWVFTDNASPVTLAFSGNLTIQAPSGEKTLTNPIVTFSKEGGLLSGYSYTLTMRVEPSKGEYYPFETATGSLYEVTIPLGTTYDYTDESGVSQSKNALTFLRYNLGADPSMTPKEQMAYPHTDDKNIRVYGGLYQWGRNDIAHTLRDPKTTANENIYFQNSQYSSYDSSTSTKFVWGSSLNNGWWLSSDVQNSNLWGNGNGLNGQTALNTNTASPNTKANANNPCPSGYRVPTQHEWALILNEGGSSTAIDNDLFNATSSDVGIRLDSSGDTWYVPQNNKEVVWVRVSYKRTIAGYYRTGRMNGWAIYAKSDVGDGSGSAATYNTAFAVNTDLTLASAPDPLLFLPTASQRNYTNGAIPKASPYGYYWSSTVSGDKSYSLYLSNAQVGVAGDVNRAFGRSVRCVKN